MASRSDLLAKLLCGSTVALGLVLGVAILRANAAFADLGRRAAAELIVPRVASGQRVWFVGHRGFQWYAEKAGARPATLTPPYPSQGDALVVSAASARSDEVLALIENLHPRQTLVGSLTDSRPGGRLTNKRLGAGFYTNVSGYWPWVWSAAPVDVFLAWQIE